MAITGGCLCGAVRYEVKAEAPLGARYCWCRVCQYLGCGAGAVGALFRKEDITVSGRLSDYVCRADSGATMHRRFCTQCGTPVFSEAEERPTLTFIRAGTLDDADLAAPTATIWTNRPRNGRASTPLCLRLKNIRRRWKRDCGARRAFSFEVASVARNFDCNNQKSML